MLHQCTVLQVPTETVTFYPVCFVFPLSRINSHRLSVEFQVTGKFRSGHNPFDNGCLRNCIQVFCASLPPRYGTFIVPFVSLIFFSTSFPDICSMMCPSLMTVSLKSLKSGFLGDLVICRFSSLKSHSHRHFAVLGSFNF